MPHKLRKTRKKRGSRTVGYGRVGQHRKTSSKGMRKPGRHKHGWTYVIKYEPNYFGKRGFTSPRSLRRKENVINVGELEEVAEKLASAGMLIEKNGKPFIDLEKLGYTKLLGEGEITKPLVVRISSYSKTADEKLQSVGGQILRET
ncbi:MAG TPA: 50S ribosomal protein L15 [Candidatus Bathyarchaeota archaeon]|nr:MAG: 50S ribosomal protein L15 [Chloroflexota bacterium]RLG91736.1 MAG: 50S ribosomal protein L15 [Candidatus Bathyarchaeota archaeon]RLI27844.1 MAG: 50S ribosomal protein L15 [Candidatus Bathyarchaeota archaeon]HDI07717.1 50S ribosomal protein L15 [Candidatus Bathyarchaeota archaeon]